MSEAVAPPVPRPARARAFALTLGSAQLVQLTGTGIGLIATPFLLGWLGPERLGAWRALESVGAYLTVLPGCLSTAVVRDSKKHGHLPTDWFPITLFSLGGPASHHFL